MAFTTYNQVADRQRDEWEASTFFNGCDARHHGSLATRISQFTVPGVEMMALIVLECNAIEPIA